MIVDLNHTGLVVKNLDEAVSFYRDAIGLSLARNVERKGLSISKVLGYTDTHIKAALMDLGNNCMLELIEYLSPRPDPRPSNERAVLGASHIAFNVVDIDSTYHRLLGCGAVGLNPPSEVAPGRHVCYMQDPSGNWIELIEDKDN